MQKTIAWHHQKLRGDYFTFQLIQNILCFASGLINALCIFDMGMTVSHQSGNTSHTGRLIMRPGLAQLLLFFKKDIGNPQILWITLAISHQLHSFHVLGMVVCKAADLVLLWIPRVRLKSLCSIIFTLALEVYFWYTLELLSSFFFKYLSYNIADTVHASRNFMGKVAESGVPLWIPCVL